LLTAQNTHCLVLVFYCSRQENISTGLSDGNL
jgi:hypothetical protein